MKYFLIIAWMLPCLSSCSHAHDIAGEYEKLSKNGEVQHVFKLHPNGTFHFDSYAVRQIEGNLRIDGNIPAEPSTGGRGTWSVENDVIYFGTDRDTDIDHNYTLNFNGTKARFKTESSKSSSDEKAIAKLEIFESGIFWIDGLEFKRRDQ